jgi:hypothetical protein
MNHFAVNLQVSSAVSRFQSRIPRLASIDSNPSYQISILECKKCQPFS